MPVAHRHFLRAVRLVDLDSIPTRPYRLLPVPRRQPDIERQRRDGARYAPAPAGCASAAGGRRRRPAPPGTAGGQTSVAIRPGGGASSCWRWRVLVEPAASTGSFWSARPADGPTLSPAWRVHACAPRPAVPATSSAWRWHSPTRARRCCSARRVCVGAHATVATFATDLLNIITGRLGRAGPGYDADLRHRPRRAWAA